MMNDDTIINLESYKLETSPEKKAKLVFFDALNYLKFQKNNSNKTQHNKVDEKKISPNPPQIRKISANETFENNISEYSITQANFSIEEHVKFLFS